ncbi:MAG TPA: hypothetical protein VFP22_02330 [Candidatus Limnocylindrales bacterium]|nr:hypothetical protein [Candidatus Limnocylindrales bacterium]
MTKRPAANAAAGENDGPGSAPAVAAAERVELTPAAALARHIEWLEYALGAATAEETARAGRVETATRKNRAKRTARLAEVRDEVEELTALLAGIRDLQAKSEARRAPRPAATRTRPAASRTPRPRPAPAGTGS